MLACLKQTITTDEILERLIHCDFLFLKLATLSALHDKSWCVGFWCEGDHSYRRLGAMLQFNVSDVISTKFRLFMYRYVCLTVCKRCLCPMYQRDGPSRNVLRNVHSTTLIVMIRCLLFCLPIMMTSHCVWCFIISL